MLQDQFFQKMHDVLQKIENTQKDTIDLCAQKIAEILVAGGVWHIFDTGHMLMYEAVGRSGGLMAARPIRVTVDMDNPVRPRETAARKKKVFMDQIPGLPEYIINKSDMVSGDVLLIGSVSGFNILPVELALLAKQRNITTIALTAVEYSKTMQAQHPSGKRLFEICDYVLDNCSPIGDAVVFEETLGQSMCPSSGIAAAYINWALQAQIIETLLRMGKTPSVYMSNHLPGAGQHNIDAWLSYEKFGY